MLVNGGPDGIRIGAQTVRDLENSVFPSEFFMEQVRVTHQNSEVSIGLRWWARVRATLPLGYFVLDPSIQDRTDRFAVLQQFAMKLVQCFPGPMVQVG